MKTVVLGIADDACFIPEGPEFRGKINNPLFSKYLDWPRGRKKQSVIDAANDELNNFEKILESRGITVLRPEPIDFNTSIKTPLWETPNMFCSTCPRDTMITIGNIILEATMSKRSRYFEHLAHRKIAKYFWKVDKNMKWKAAPKPSMADDMYWQGYWTKFQGFDQKSEEEQEAILKDYQYILNEEEPAFDAADITR